MEHGQALDATHPRVMLHRMDAESPFFNLAEDVRQGLSGRPKRLAPKYFYDKEGSELFERICSTREYYPTRVENGLLARHAVDIIDRTRPDMIVELGSGSSRKTTHLLSACHGLGCYAKYQPVDICAEMLREAGHRLSAHYSWLEIEGVVGDYCLNMRALPQNNGSRLFVFLGGTLGNFDEQEALSFLCQLNGVMEDCDHFLFGVDRVKDAGVLNAAYNDAQGYTAAFNRNILNVINRELSGEFDLQYFEHCAWFNEDHSRIEMHLRSTRDQVVPIRQLGMDIDFLEDETILTEISRKFTPDSFTALLHSAGFAVEDHYQPDDGYFSLILAKPARS